MNVTDLIKQVREARKDLFDKINSSKDVPKNMKTSLATTEWDSRVAQALIKVFNHVTWSDSRELVVHDVLQILKGKKDDTK